MFVLKLGDGMQIIREKGGIKVGVVRLVKKSLVDTFLFTSGLMHIVACRTILFMWQVLTN